MLPHEAILLLGNRNQQPNKETLKPEHCRLTAGFVIRNCESRGRRRSVLLVLPIEEWRWLETFNIMSACQLEVPCLVLCLPRFQ